MKILIKLTAFLFLFIFNLLQAADYTIFSVDRNIVLTVNASGSITWSVSYKNNPAIDKCEIAMNIYQQCVLGSNPIVNDVTTKTVDEKIHPIVPYKFSEISDNYNKLTLSFKNNFTVEFRVYNDGVAYRFITSFSKEISVTSESMNLKFPDNTISYFPEEYHFVSHYEPSYKILPLDSISKKQFCLLPVLMKTNDNINVLFTEADLYDYPGMFLIGNSDNTLKSVFPKHVLEADADSTQPDRNEIISKTADYIAKTSGNRSFPWRVFIINDEDGKLIESSLVYQLSRPLQIKDYNWIRPGKVAWDWYNANNLFGVDFRTGMNTATYKYYIDFASEYGLEYIILDEGWSSTSTNVLEGNPDIDVSELIRYGKSKNVGIILWLLWKPLDENMKEILETYHKWGAKGVKVDFMQRTDQYMVNFYERVAIEAAKQHLLVDFHGAFKPSGLNRAYPNVLSFEGVKGNEHNKWSKDITPAHTVTVPFIRMFAGPMDFTPGAITNAGKDNFRIRFTRPMSQGTRCHQVAMYVVYESPLQMLCDLPSKYLRDKKTSEFISQIPTIWDETKVLDAKVGEYILLARRNGNTWYIGAMSDWNTREMEIIFSFLLEGKYKIEIMQDGINADRYAEDYKKVTKEIDNNTKMHIELAPGGGWAAIIKKYH